MVRGIFLMGWFTVATSTVRAVCTFLILTPSATVGGPVGQFFYADTSLMLLNLPL